MKKIIHLLILSFLLVGCININIQKSEQLEQLVGDDRDEHGCVGSAGYSWCEIKEKCLHVEEEKCENEQINQKETDVITYLVSEKDKLEYCDGENMDSDGYKKTIVFEIKSDIPVDGLSKEELAQKVVVLATDDMCQNVMKQLDLKVIGETVHIPPIDSWSGASITMCSCRPLVEVNLLRLPGIEKVTWGSTNY